MATKTKLKAPSGLSIVRNGTKFTFSWTKGDNGYTDQNLKWKDNIDDFTTVPDNKVKKGTTRKTVSIDLKDYYPNRIKYSVKPIGGSASTEQHIVDCPKLKFIKFGVQGEEKSKDTNNKLIKSDWSYKKLEIKPPKTPKLTAALSGTYSNTTTFSWSIDYGKYNDKTSPNMLLHYEYYTILLKDTNISSAKKIKDWSKGSHDTTTSTSKTIVEDTPFNNTSSYTRFFKIRAVGPAGVSDWAYAKHVYAYPHQSKNVKASAKALSGNAGYTVNVSWTLDKTNAHPVDKVVVQYALAVPKSSYKDVNGVRVTTLSTPDLNDGDWQDAPGGTIKDTNASDGITFRIGEKIEDNMCVFVRVNAHHDSRVTPGAPAFVTNGYGPLTSPSGLSVTVSQNIATISLTNNSEVNASFVGIYYRTTVNTKAQLIGIWPANQSSPITVAFPDPGSADFSFGISAFVADYTPINPAVSGVTAFSISQIKMSSGMVWDDRPVPKAPNIKLSSPQSEVVRVEWDWNWQSANGVELSWANHDDAWESTDEPTTYVISDTRASAWNIAGLSPDLWYFRVRLFKTDGDVTTYGTYSNIESYRVLSSPDTPVLTLSSDTVQPGGQITCYWVYSSSENDEQTQANICEATIDSNGNVTYGAIIAKANDEQYVNLTIPDTWAAGEQHYLAVKVISTSGSESDNWSNPKSIMVLNPVVCSIVSTSLTTETVVIDDETGETATELLLANLPMEVEATGADSGGKITYILERAEPFHRDRPDENELTGFEGETIAVVEKTANNSYELTTDTTVNSSTTYYTRSGSDADSYIYTEVQPASGANPSALGYYVLSGFNFQASIDNDDLVINLDDGARYNLIAIAEDSYGQVSEEVSVAFLVQWAHQAVMPTGIVEADDEEIVVFITPQSPEEAAADPELYAGDVCDIYRLSTDKPELIVEGATFGVTYVDPYPALGPLGGHRLVYRTSDGDYITEDNTFAWTDYSEDDGDIVDVFATIIDFGGDQAILPYDLSLSTSWNKDFTETKYLGGAVQGDWNPAVSRTGSIKTRVAVRYDQELIETMRRLAVYSGICHVRTPDGSSYAANVNVTEDREEKKINMIASFSLNITRIDSEGFDGMTYDEWIGE